MFLGSEMGVGFVVQMLLACMGNLPPVVPATPLVASKACYVFVDNSNVYVKRRCLLACLISST